MRKYSISSLLFSLSSTLSNDCSQDCTNHNFGSQTLTLNENSRHEFTNCTWSDSSSPDAGAITFRDKISSHLEVDKCTFTRCISTASDYKYSGGAINAYNMRSVNIKSSLFLLCSCTASNGGGINLFQIIQQPFIDRTNFVSCSSCDDGGAVSVFFSSAEDSCLCRECRIINCSVPYNCIIYPYPWAGGIILYKNSNTLRCTDTLFSHNTGTHGGA